MVGVHYMAHWTNLVVQNLSNFEVVRNVEDLLATLYSYFYFFLNFTLEFQNLAVCLESRVLKSLGIPRPIRYLFSACIEGAWGVQNFRDNDSNGRPKEATKKNFSMLLDWHNMLTLPCLMPMLHYVNPLTEFAQSPTCYIIHFCSKDLPRWCL